MCNKKAVIIGGSNGIGLAISKKLLDCGYDLEICDRIPPEEGILEETKVTYHFCDLMGFVFGSIPDTQINRSSM